MKKTLVLLIALWLPVMIAAQTVNWNDVTGDYDFPEGLKLYHGTISGNNSFFAYYYEVDLSVPNIAIRPYLVASPAQVHHFSENVGAYGAINGGFFAGAASVSSIIYPNEVPARNLISVNRFGNTYPVIRSVFALNHDRSMSAEWVYHHSYAFEDIYIYDEPMPYACDDPNPLPIPLKADGYVYESIAYGIGGGPMLIKDGEINITYCEEIFWGSGVFMTDYRPRTAVGYTPDNKAILFVTNHMMIGDMADLLLEIGCYEAMNLDGGGSTAMAAGGQSIYTQGRAVPSILAVVHSDSLNIPKIPLFEKTIDTSDEGVTSSGNWFATANEGFWESPSMLHELASHDEYYDFPLNLPAEAEYEIYAWWTSHANRAADTPFFITHADGVTEIAVDQTIGGSMWNLIGTFNFTGSEEESVRITAGATTNQFVVADGIRIVSYDQQFFVNVITHIEGVDDISVPFGTSKEEALAMLDQQTTITDMENNTYTVDLTWQADDYDGNVPANYEATATFELPEGVEQTDPPTPLEVHAVITVREINVITYIEGVDDISVPFGTLKEEALAMLDQQTTITDMENNTYTVDLTWQADGYDGNVPADYEALATFKLPEGVEQTDPPTPLKVHATITVEEDESTGITQLAEQQITIYPNPGKGQFTLAGELEGTHRLSILSIDGILHYTTHVNGLFDKKIDLSAQPAGIYFIRVSGPNTNQTLKVINK